MTEPKNPQNGQSSKVIGAPSDEILDLLDPDQKIHYLKDHIQKLLTERQNYENQVLKEVLKAPADKKKDALISELQANLEKNIAIKDNLEIKLSKALDTVEGQLNIKKDSKTYTLYDRILRLGSSGFSILESLKLQIVDCLTTDVNNFDYIQDTLYNINSSLGDPDESIESDSKLDNIETKMVEVQQVAFGLNHTDLQVRKSLQTSIGVQHDLFSLIKLLRTRINKLKQQVQFLKEHRESMDDKDISQDNAIGDYSGGSFVSAAFQSSAPSVSSYRPSIPERNKLYYKKHNSVETNHGEEIDPHALSISIRAEIEHEFNEKTFKMQQELGEAQAKAQICEKEKELMSSKLEKSKSEYEALVTKYKKLFAQNKDNQTKSDGLEKKLAVAKKQIAKLTGKPVNDIVDEEQEKIKKLTANIVELKKRYEKSKEDLAKSNEELNSSKEKIILLEADKTQITEDLQAQINDLKTKLSSATSENEKLTKYVNAYKKNYSESKKSNESLKTQLSKVSNDAALQLKESNKKLETHFSDSKKTEEKLKLQNKKLLDSLNSLRSVLGLNEINTDNSDESQDDINDEALQKVNQIIEKSNYSSNQLKSIRKSLGIPEDESETSSNEQNSLQQKIESMQKQNEKLKEQRRLMRINLGLNEEEEEEEKEKSDQSQPKSTVANELKKLKDENEKMKDSLKKIYNKIGKSEIDENNLDPNELCDSIQTKLDDIMDTHDKLEEMIGYSSESKDDNEMKRKPSMIEGIQQFKLIQNRILDINSKEGFVNAETNSDESKTCLEILNKLYSTYKTQETFTKQLNSIMNINNEEDKDPNRPPLTPEERMNEMIKEITTLKKGKEQLKTQLDSIRTHLNIPQPDGENPENEDIASNIISLIQNNEQLKTREQELIKGFGLEENENGNASENIIQTHQDRMKENEQMKQTINTLYDMTNKTLNKEVEKAENQNIDEISSQAIGNMKDLIKLKERLIEERSTLLTKLGLPVDDFINNNNKDDDASSTHSSVEDIIEQHQKMKETEERLKANHRTLENLLGINKDSKSNDNNDPNNEQAIETQIKNILEENDALQTQVQTIRQQLEDIQTNELNQNPNPNKPDSHSHLNIAEIKENGEIISQYVQTLGDEYLKEKNKGQQLQKEMEELKSTFNLSENEEVGVDGVKSKENLLMTKLANTLHESDQNKALLSTIKEKIGLVEQADEDNLLNKLNEYKNMQDRILEINAKEEFINENENKDDSKYCIDIINKFYDRYKENESFTNKINSIMNPNGDKNDKENSSKSPEERMNEMIKEITTLRKDKEQLDTIRTKLNIPQGDGENPENDDIASNIISLIQNNEQLKTREQELIKGFGLEESENENGNQNIIQTHQDRMKENEQMKQTINTLYDMINKTLNKEGEKAENQNIDEISSQTIGNMKDLIKLKEQLIEERSSLLTKLGLPVEDININDNNNNKDDDASSTHSSVEDIIEQHQKMKETEERLKANHRTLENLLGINNDSKSNDNNDPNNEQAIETQIKNIFEENDALQTQVQTIRQQLEDIQTNESNKDHESTPVEQQKKHLNLSEIKDNGEIIEKQIQKLSNDHDQLQQEVKELKLTNEKMKKSNDKLREQKKIMRMHLGLNEEEEEDNDDAESGVTNELRNLKDMKEMTRSSSGSKDDKETKRKPSMIEGIQQFKLIQNRILDINSKEGFVNAETNSDESKTCLEILNKLYSTYKTQETFTKQLNSIMNINGEEDKDPNRPPLTPEERMNEMIKEITTLKKGKEQLKTQLDSIRTQLNIPQLDGENPENDDIASNIISLIQNNEQLKTREQELIKGFGLEENENENGNQNIIQTHQDRMKENEQMKQTINTLYDMINKTLNKEGDKNENQNIDEISSQTIENMKDLIKLKERLIEERSSLLTKLGLPVEDININNDNKDDDALSKHSSVEDIIEQHQKMKETEEHLKANHRTLENLLGINKDSKSNDNNDPNNEQAIETQIKNILEENDALQTQVQTIRQQLEDIQTNELNSEPNSTTKRSKRKQPQNQKQHLNLDEINDTGEIIERQIDTLADEYSKVKNDHQNLQREMKKLKSKFNIEDEMDENAESTDAIINKHKNIEEENKLMKKTLENIFKKTSKSDELPLNASDLCDNVIEDITRIIEDAGTLNECQEILKGNSNENDGIKQTLSNLQKRSNEFDQLKNQINEQNDEISDLKSKLIEKDSKINGILEERSAYQDLLIEVKDSIDNPKSGNQTDSPLFQKLLTLSEEVSNYHKLSDKMNSLLDERSRSIAFLENEGFISPTSSTEERDKINVPNQIKYLIDQIKESKQEIENDRKEKQVVLNLLKGNGEIDISNLSESNSDIVMAFKKIKENEKTLELQSSQLNQEIVQLKDSLEQIKNSVGFQNSDESVEEFDINQIIEEISHKAKIATKLNEFIELTDHEESVKEIIDDFQPEEYKPPEGKSKALQMIEKLEAFNVKYEQMCKENEDFKNEFAKIKEIFGISDDEEIPLSSITEKIKNLKESSSIDNEEGISSINKKPIDQLNEIQNLLNDQLPIQNDEESNESQNSNANMAGKLKEIIYQETKFEDQLNKIIDTTMNSPSEQKKDAKMMLKENKLDDISEKVSHINNEYISLKSQNKPLKSQDENEEDNNKIKIDSSAADGLRNILESLSQFPDIEQTQEPEFSQIEITNASIREINEKINEICQNYKKLKEENAQLLEDKMKSENEQSSLINQILGEDVINNENNENGENVNVNEMIKEKVKALQSSQKEISQYQEAISNLQNEKSENEQQIDKLNQKINNLLNRLENSQSNIRLQESDFTSLDFFEVGQGNDNNNNNEKVFNYSNENIFNYTNDNINNQQQKQKIINDNNDNKPIENENINNNENKPGSIDNDENNKEKNITKKNLAISNENKSDDEEIIHSEKNKKSPTGKTAKEDQYIEEEEEEVSDQVSHKDPTEKGKEIHGKNEKQKTKENEAENSFENGNQTEIKFENDDENETEIKLETSDNEIQQEKSNKNNENNNDNVIANNKEENANDNEETNEKVQKSANPNENIKEPIEDDANIKEKGIASDSNDKNNNEILDKNSEKPKEEEAPISTPINKEDENKESNENENTKKTTFENDQTAKSFKDKITDLEQRCNELEGHVDNLKAKNRKLTKEKNQLCKVLNIDIDAENDEQQDKSSKHSPLVMNVKEMKQNMQAKEIENEKLNDLVNEQKSKMQEIENSNREMAQQLEDAKKSINSLLNEKKSLADVLGIELENGQNPDSSLCSSVKNLKKKLSESNKEAEQLKSNISEFEDILQPNSGKKKSGKGEVFSVNDVLGQLKTQLNDLTQSNEEKDETIKDLKESIAQQEDQSKNNESKIAKLNKQNLQLKKQLEDADKLNETEVSELNEKNSKLRKQMKEQNEKSEIEITKLRKQIEQQNEQNDENEKEISKLTDKNEKLKKQIREQSQLNEDKIVKLNRENQKLKEKVEQLNESQKENEKIKSEVDSAIDALQKKEKDDFNIDDYSNSPLLTETHNAISLIRDQKAKIDKLNQERKSILEAVYGESYDNQNGSGLLEELELLGNQMNEQTEKMNNSINEDNDSSSPVKSPISPRQRSAPRTSNSIADAMNKLREQLNEATEANLAKDAQIEELNQKIEELEGKQKDIENDDNSIQISLSFSANEVILDQDLKMPNKKADPRTILQEHLLISNLLSDDKEVSEDEISRFPLALRVKELQNKAASYLNVLDSLSNLFGHVDEDESDDFSHLTARVQEIYAINSALQSELAKLKEKLKMRPEDLDAGFIEEEEEKEGNEENSQIELSEIIDLLHIEGNTRMDDIKDTIAQLQKYENELREIQEILDQEQNGGTKNDEEIATRVKHLVKTNQELKVKIESLYSKLSDLNKNKEENHRYSRQIKDIENKMSEKDDNINQIQRMLKINQSKNEARKQKELISSLEKENKKLKQQNDENEQLISKLQKEIEKLNQERNLIFDSFDNDNDDENAKNNEGNPIQNKIGGMKEKLKISQEKCQNLEDEINEYRKQIQQKESENDSLSNEINECRKQIQQKESENDSLLDKINKLNAQNDSLLDKINKLNTQNDSLTKQISKLKQYSDDYEEENENTKSTKSRSTKSINVNQLESQIKNLNEEMKKKDDELAQIKQSLSPFINPDSDEESNENDVFSSLRKISDDNQKMKKDVKSFEKERRDIGKLFEIINIPPPNVKKNSGDNENQQKSFPAIIKDKVNDLIKQAKKYEAKKFDKVIQLNEELKDEIEEKNQIIKELKDSLNPSSKNKTITKSSQTNLEKESILKKIEQAKNDLKEIGVNTKSGKEGSSTKAIQNRIEVILNEVESFIYNSEPVQLQNISSNTEYDNLVSTIAQTICPDNDKTSIPTQTKISAIISNLSLKIQQQKEEILTIQPNIKKDKVSSNSDDDNNNDENIRQQKMRTVDTLENILHQMESVKAADPSNNQQMLEAISKLKHIGQQLEDNENELKFIFNVNNPKLFTDKQYKDLLKKIENQVNSMLKTLYKTVKISPPEDIVIKTDNSYSDHKEFDIELDGDAYIMNVNKSFVKICAAIKKQFSISTTNMQHLTKNESILANKNQELESKYKKLKDKLKSNIQEIEDLTQTNKKLSKKLTKLQNNLNNATDFLFAMQPSIKDRVNEDSPMVDIIRFFVYEYGKHVCKHAGKAFVNRLNMIKKSQDTIFTAFSKLNKKVKNLEDNYAKLTYSQSPSRSVQKKSKK